jgi:hypothetical protein
LTSIALNARFARALHSQALLHLAPWYQQAGASFPSLLQFVLSF